MNNNIIVKIEEVFEGASKIGSKIVCFQCKWQPMFTKLKLRDKVFVILDNMAIKETELISMPGIDNFLFQQIIDSSFEVIFVVDGNIEDYTNAIAWIKINE